MKNKKGAKNQKFIAQVEKQVKSGGQHPLGALTKKDEKEKKLQEQKELLALFRLEFNLIAYFDYVSNVIYHLIFPLAYVICRPVQTQKVEKGTDPKSVVCAFFKAGQCTKGDKCKFSHDLAVERKVEKRSMYVDMRDDDDNMENWNDEKLQEVVDKKHGKDKLRPTTEIVGFMRRVLLAGLRINPRAYLCIFRFASFSWRLSKSPNTDGSGSVRMEKDAFTGTPCPRATY